MDPAYQVRTFNLCLSSTLHYVKTFLMKKRNLKRNESPTCELYDTYDLRASLRVFPKKSKTRRSPRKKQRSQDWSEDLKIDQNLRDQIEHSDIKLSKLVNTTENICYFWILAFDHISLRFDKGVNSGLQSLPRNNIRKSKIFIKETNI